MNGWDWRKSSGGVTLPSDTAAGERLFHAYDGDDLAACSPGYGLLASCEEPNEGSRFCRPCMVAVKAGPSAEVLT